ncbi:MAG: hypothetical protein JSW72_05815 [Candidatus Bathyarchaeota archaeon]|nr:MAG: hypothetical protein JSW72_05815 [Candidatus Bathyarchaeota archaeon]
MVSIVLVTAIITTYSIIRNNPLQNRPQILGTIDEMNIAIDHILEFSVAYYGSILQVTGNTTYAKSLAAEYMQSSLENIAYIHPDWSPTFNISHFHVTIAWFNKTSLSEGAINVTYDLTGIGIYGIQYGTSVSLTVTVNPSQTSSVLVNVTRDGDSSYPSLSAGNFFFYNYSYTESSWKLNNTGVTINSITSSELHSVYNLTVPSGIDASAYMIQVVDSRGITVAASTFSHYSYTFSWNQPLYSPLSQDTLVIEVLQNGTLKSLGQNLELTTASKPIPPIPVKAFHVNQTINGQNREVPFQIEDWGSNYQVPAGLTSNVSVFSRRQMFVFLANHNVENVLLWWDGRDIADQTAYAWQNRYFTADDPDNGVLTNNILTLSITNFLITSQLGSSSSTAEFLRINGEDPTYGADPSYVIHHGVVRDIVQQEAEWSNGIFETANLYVDGFDQAERQWRESGSSPYLDDTTSSYIDDNDDFDQEGWFSFQNLSVTSDPISVKIQFESSCQGDEYFDFEIDNGTHTLGYYPIDPPSSYGWREHDLSDILDTAEKVNTARLRVRYRFNSGSAYDVYIRRCRLAVEVGVPNVYSQIVLTLPANATYYTYTARTIFVDSAQGRAITSLNAIQLAVSTGQQLSENATFGGYPVTSSAEGLFYNYSSPTGWAHHWSQFISGNTGAGIMFTDRANKLLYFFDGVGGEKTGALKVANSGRIIEVNPVEMASVSFQYALDISWCGAVVNFDGTDPIHPELGSNIGLWAIVEDPPSIAVDTG